MDTQPTSIQHRLLLGDEAEKRAALGELYALHRNALIKAVIQKHNYPIQKAKEEVVSIISSFFHQYIWNNYIDKTLKRGKKDTFLFRQYFYHHFLNITQNLSNVNEWNYLHEIINLIENNPSEELFPSDTLENAPTSCQILKGNNELKAKIITQLIEDYFNKIKDLVKKRVFDADNYVLKRNTNTVFSSFYEDLTPYHIPITKFNQLYYYIVLRTKEIISPCEDFNLFTELKKRVKYINFDTIKEIKFEDKKKVRIDTLDYYSEQLLVDITAEEKIVKSFESEFIYTEEAKDKYFAYQKISLEIENIFNEIIQLEKTQENEENELENEIEEENNSSLFGKVTNFFSEFFNSNKKKELKLLKKQKNKLLPDLLLAAKNYLSIIEREDEAIVIYKAVLPTMSEKCLSYVKLYHTDKVINSKKEAAERLKLSEKAIYDYDKKLKAEADLFKCDIALLLNDDEKLKELSEKRKDVFIQRLLKYVTYHHQRLMKNA